MGTSRISVRLLLRSICHDGGWNYAVFWKPKNQNGMLLTWDEAYCDFRESQDVNNVHTSPGVNYTNEFNCSDEDTSGYHGSDLQVAMATMSRCVYSLGEGVISQIVASGKHHWVFAEKNRNYGENSELVYELPDEWKFQFAAGIRTIVLVPVMPDGPVQLGALSTVREEQQLVDHVRSLFSPIYLPFETGFSFTSVGCPPQRLPPMGSLVPGSSSSMPYNFSQQTSLEILFERSPGLAVLDADQVTKFKLSNDELSNSPLLMVEDDLQMWHDCVYVHKFGPGSWHCADGKVIDSVSTASVEPCTQNLRVEENCLNVSAGVVHGEIKRQANQQSPSDIPDQTFPDENMISDVSFGLQLGSETFLNDLCSFVSEECTAYQLFGSARSVEMSEIIADDTFRFHGDSEPHKVLGRTSCKGATYFCKGAVAGIDGFSTESPVVDQFSLEDGAEDLLGEIKEWLMDESSSEHLLDAIVADVCISPNNKSVTSQSTSAKQSDNSFTGCDLYFETQNNVTNSMVDRICHDTIVENVPFRLTDVRPSSRTQEAAFAYCKTQSIGAQSEVLLPDLEHWSYLGHGFIPWSEESAMISVSGSRIDDPKRMNWACDLSKNEVKLPKTNKKSRPGESRRPRPRDRQQIQDRIRELREIVPNGAMH